MYLTLGERFALKETSPLLRERHANDSIVGAVYGYIIAQTFAKVNNDSTYCKTYYLRTSNNLH